MSGSVEEEAYRWLGDVSMLGVEVGCFVGRRVVWEYDSWRRKGGTVEGNRRVICIARKSAS